ncbi:unnamed protein product [Aspergillus oryzae]|uniref:Unnamed protein product n=2 Tax=Aspergillus oryzae TaxID=5062 RepID=A0AAN4YF84_ASPOZ|nr:unnamed protein product [Aspergillus oryzae]GMF90455.1 unnamed protein product [Aspergillus oryzae]GMG07517.1 unnamed protein product [Aspergillus oryzae]GMG25880.1 unnamed protein product [Aspergillus oryzae]GMG51023.1 unnamed protein product [Aspergillus oryzae var. brunneus]
MDLLFLTPRSSLFDPFYPITMLTHIRALEVLPQLKVYFDGLEELRKSELEWTVFHIGMFMDYFATPALKSYLKPHIAALDLENKVAAIPGDGKVPVTLIYSFDMARFVVASLDLEHWEEESRVVGDEITWNEFLVLAEEARGEYSFTTFIRYLSTGLAN